MTYYEGSEPYILLNYAPADLDRIAPVLAALEREGFRSWAPEAVKPGEDWAECVAEHLEKAHCCTCILTKGFEEAKDRHKVLRFAINEGVPVLVVYLEEVKLTAGLRMQLSLSPALHCTQYANQEAFTAALCAADLLSACKKTVVGTSAPQAVAQRPAVPPAPADMTPPTETVSAPSLSSVSANDGIPCYAPVRYSEGLAFRRLDDGTYEVTGMGTCKDTELVIPPTTQDGGKVTRIGKEAFDRYYSKIELTSVSIPRGVTSIESFAFMGQKKLTTVSLPDGLISVKHSAFCGCNTLRDFSIPSSVIEIGGSAFNGCRGMSELAIPHRVASIGSNAFYGWKDLQKVTIPESVTSISYNPFGNCHQLKTIEVAPANPRYYSQDNCVIERKTKRLVIGTQTSRIPSDVYTIGSWAFYGVTDLSEITLPPSVTKIEIAAFEECSQLISITIPASVTDIGGASFRGCSDLSTIQVDPANPVYYSQGNCVIERKTKKLVIGIRTSQIPSDVRMIGDNAFEDCKDLTEIKIPQGSTAIGAWAFRGCRALTTVTIPISVESMGMHAFSDDKKAKIYCEAPSRPKGWDTRWAEGVFSVVWNYKPE